MKNPASASNFGGVWERQIRSIRNVMSGLIREHGDRLDEESLRTFLCEAESTAKQASDGRDTQRSSFRATSDGAAPSEACY